MNCRFCAFQLQRFCQIAAQYGQVRRRCSACALCFGRMKEAAQRGGAFCEEARASQGLTPSRQPVDAHAHSMHKRAWQHAVAMVTGLRGLPVVVAATSASSVPARMKSCVTAKHCLALTTSSTSPAASSCARGDDNRDGSLAGPWLLAALCTRRDEASLKRRTGNIPSRPFGYDQV